MKKPSTSKREARRPQDEILLRKLAVAAVNNADSLLSDATVLAEKGSFGHSFALAVLAEEELGKGTFLWLAALDKEARFAKDGKITMGGRAYWPFGSHQLKQAVQLGPQFFMELISPIITAVQDLHEKGTLTADAVIKLVEDRIAPLMQDQDSFLTAMKPLAEIVGLDSEKQKGLYVGYDKQGDVIQPSNFEKSRCEELIKRVSQRIAPTRKTVETGLVPEAEEIFRSMYPLFNKIDFYSFAKRFRRGLSQRQIQKEVRRMKKIAVAGLREAMREQKQSVQH